mgnify:FL=1
MKHAYVFPGQGAQAVGMGKDLYDNVPEAKALFEQANEILGFRITDIMFAGTDEELKQTKVTQPAVFLHSVIMAKALGVKPDAVAGHSLGEFSAWWWPALFRSKTVCGSFPNVRWPCRKPAKPYPVRWRRSWDSTTPK